MLMFIKAYFFLKAKCPVWTVAFCIPLQSRPPYITHYLLQCHYQLKADDTDVSSLSFLFYYFVCLCGYNQMVCILLER